jgi:hypothetical protein
MLAKDLSFFAFRRLSGKQKIICALRSLRLCGVSLRPLSWAIETTTFGIGN